MKTHSKESIELIEQRCMEDYREHEGKILLATCIHGYVDCDSHEFSLKKPARVLVTRNQKENSMLNWTTSEWCDPNWDVELLEPHEELSKASSLWVDGISRNVDGKYYDFSGDWKIDPNQDLPTLPAVLVTPDTEKRDAAVDAVLNPKKDKKPASTHARTHAHREKNHAYREKAREFFRNELDENEWDIDDEPTVSVSEHGAYVQIWKWFPAEEQDEE